MPNRSGSHGIFGPLLAPPLSTCPSLHLVHIPKNGGTAVEAHLHRFGCEVGFCRIAPLGWSSRENKCSYGSWWHMPTVFTSADLSKAREELHGPSPHVLPRGRAASCLVPASLEATWQWT
mmetsp:Transcript_11211/g.31120  ORF Transcript_11211/g.31120 Transcript_11211/m.31120 type:complete len:120 (+) Transcript_11211:86-445(+)